MPGSAMKTVALLTKRPGGLHEAVGGDLARLVEADQGAQEASDAARPGHARANDLAGEAQSGGLEGRAAIAAAGSAGGAAAVRTSSSIADAIARFMAYPR